MSQQTSCPNAQLRWCNNQPFSTQYEDVYFNSENGLEETDYVFLQGNSLTERFQTSAGKNFVIAETGFGSGMNFLSTWKLWQEHAPENARLHYISAERFPFSKEDLQKAMQTWPEFQPFLLELIQQYPPLMSGFHRLSFPDSRITLTLMFGDATNMYSQLTARIDAWFLDGFAPSKNADMWHEDLFRTMATLSHSETTFATFTSASKVRKGLQAAGFEIRKIPGFGPKREILTGQFSSTQPVNTGTPWLTLPLPPAHQKHAIIIGAGLAGACTAWSLVQRGWKVEVIDQHPAAAQAGSGNHQGALYAKLPAKPISSSQLHLQGFLHALNFLQSNIPAEGIWNQCGMLQLATTDKEKLRQEALVKENQYPEALIHAVESSQASKIAGQNTPHSGLYIPDAGWVSPVRLCNYLLQHPDIHCRFNTRVDKISRTGDNWHLYDNNDQLIASSAIVVVAGASETKRFEQLSHLPVKPIRGQVSLKQATSEAPVLNTVICGEGYISPPLDNQWCFGASFDVKTPSDEIRAEDHQSNFKKLQDVLPELAEHFATQTESPLGRVSHRCASADYLPIIGAAPDYNAFISDFDRLRKDSKWQFDCQAKYHPGLYVNLAHGSKGLITAPLGGELLADILNMTPIPLEKNLINVMNPARFIIKNLKKGTI
ncbi:bifunctional tRNA (5-methylaminomethyl-2-thiouridine)(34)-methyltransferase MnmD/FAD-dependent 5-carboxymethylaminomethyl-2-thiouridine(34) oxidoreductase MnmC [Aliamphritea spongicola]|uniref:bifunctional tRNA (5-methylaminomethyl-2-thiouridine)(34)-methyltransferase MnmD/FAD-dependent 5-carboxymethylaminomethyl-2-thiouridine(34) oxidoreductase MnmC n=1 Tax=Aliamphritea spongicola TaxID=707589 RepID=UPI00196B800C|nr:bifunctional tRNA (5-methylaminomethyl-2-thiouridine)(34)-methyltransferase MnmD/FAD-dependent 5-carboxymethylaminomethyl-2-thiouridine(34) oxidoreductase MnmC [Aliamphritea spongicola]MBN3563558.1 bifunctional tRNA (5-methylaminomethyl-2-thiouridine)(34)-methyltransferase MnmD/FAD-dependent 5-carboxymethylaminomethyl-2-thiouridine(34) oxidoreductase MnmC [Aliamphritea spongicola]